MKAVGSAMIEKTVDGKKSVRFILHSVGPLTADQLEAAGFTYTSFRACWDAVATTKEEAEKISANLRVWQDAGLYQNSAK